MTLVQYFLSILFVFVAQLHVLLKCIALPVNSAVTWAQYQNFNGKHNSIAKWGLQHTNNSHTPIGALLSWQSNWVIYIEKFCVQSYVAWIDCQPASLDDNIPCVHGSDNKKFSCLFSFLKREAEHEFST